MLIALCERTAAAVGFTRLELLTTPAGRRLYTACGFADVERDDRTSSPTASPAPRLPDGQALSDERVRRPPSGSSTLTTPLGEIPLATAVAQLTVVKGRGKTASRFDRGRGRGTARAPRRVPHVGHVRPNPPLVEFRTLSINIVDDEPVRRAVVRGSPIPWRRAIERAARSRRGVRRHTSPGRGRPGTPLETELGKEADGRLDVARHEDGLDLP